MSKNEIKMWAIKRRDGTIITQSLRDTKRDCISDEEFEQGFIWKSLSSELGYSCVQVIIKERGAP